MKNGITAIALVITIIILLILAGVVISAVMGENSVVENAEDAKLATEFAKYKEEVDRYLAKKFVEDYRFSPNSLYAGQTRLEYNTQKDGETGQIRTIITSMADKYKDRFEVVKGQLYLIAGTARETRIAKSVGIETYPFLIENGVLLSAGANLDLADGVDTIIIPEAVTSIGEGAFSSVKGVKNIVVPSAVKRIEKNAFSNNSSIETVIIKEGVEYLGDYAFADCSSLKTIQLPNSLKTLGYRCFYCSGLVSITIPDGVIRLPDGCFEGCGNLEECYLPDGMTTLGSSAFYGCAKMTSLNVPLSLAYLGGNTFADCRSLGALIIDPANENFVFSEGILYNKDSTKMFCILPTAIGDSTEFTIPDTVTDIGGNRLLYGYDQITTVNVPATVTDMGDFILFQRKEFHN